MSDSSPTRPAPRERAFAQVDVFTAEPYRGNPVAVVLDGDGLDEAAMRRFAAWTNLSETTFVLPPTEPGADYRLRIFTPGEELPFAGHPTLGSAHAWLASGAGPSAAAGGDVVQECAAGLIRVRRDAGRLAFAAPPTLRSGPVDPSTLERVIAGLRIDAGEVVAARWVDNGPGWLGVLLRDAATVRGLRPDGAALADLKIGVAGLEPEGTPTRVEVRAFALGAGIAEDPVTGSLNASLAQWLIADGVLPRSYVAAQGTVLGRAGRVHVTADGDDVWVGGDAVTCIRGTVIL
ncbi:phenazine biosynthesis protein PhzF [Tersicoccus solisilvae]|uniref:Phenazine biosynthesis protein PhzF n=1 Tax=Tersicoccus solisilvae TaxID=1882339 RepID=A0ABQ1NPL0_9MICC|nr:PhzF family phenazine biosynthesis protein [Tersicoccus solisilvae]GGC80550.1 phenazine biosynthesis protein PhzF [Tersicoccus solisilvae]